MFNCSWFMSTFALFFCGEEGIYWSEWVTWMSWEAAASAELGLEPTQTSALCSALAQFARQWLTLFCVRSPFTNLQSLSQLARCLISTARCVRGNLSCPTLVRAATSWAQSDSLSTGSGSEPHWSASARPSIQALNSASRGLLHWRSWRHAGRWSVHP